MKKKLLLILFLLISLFSFADDLDTFISVHTFISQINESQFKLKTPDKKIDLVVDGKDYFLQNPKQLKKLTTEKIFKTNIYLENGTIFLAKFEETESENYNLSAEKKSIQWLMSNQYVAKDFNYMSSEDFLPQKFTKDSLENVMTLVGKKDFSGGYYCSDVTAVSQYGKAIYFKGKTKSKVMTIPDYGRTKQNEKVTVYYSAEKDLESKYVEWTVIAIKKSGK